MVLLVETSQRYAAPKKRPTLRFGVAVWHSANAKRVLDCLACKYAFSLHVGWLAGES